MGIGRVYRRYSWTIPSPLHFESSTVIVSGGVGGLKQCSWCNQKRMVLGYVVAQLRHCSAS